MTVSALDDIPGLGEIRRKALLRQFGSLKRLGAASIEEIAEVPGVGRRTAEAIKAALSGDARPRSGDGRRRRPTPRARRCGCDDRHGDAASGDGGCSAPARRPARPGAADAGGLPADRCAGCGRPLAAMPRADDAAEADAGGPWQAGRRALGGDRPRRPRICP